MRNETNIFWWIDCCEDIKHLHQEIRISMQQFNMSSTHRIRFTLHFDLSPWPLFQGSLSLVRIERRHLTWIPVTVSGFCPAQLNFSLFCSVQAFFWFPVSAAMPSSTARAALIRMGHLFCPIQHAVILWHSEKFPIPLVAKLQHWFTEVVPSWPKMSDGLSMLF